MDQVQFMLLNKEDRIIHIRRLINQKDVICYFYIFFFILLHIIDSELVLGL